MNLRKTNDKTNKYLLLHWLFNNLIYLIPIHNFYNSMDISSHQHLHFDEKVSPNETNLTNMLTHALTELNLRRVASRKGNNMK